MRIKSIAAGILGVVFFVNAGIIARATDRQLMTISGRVVLKGQASSSRLVLETRTYGDLNISGRHAMTLYRNYQGQFIMARGIMTRKKQGVAYSVSFEIVQIVKVFKVKIEYQK